MYVSMLCKAFATESQEGFGPQHQSLEMSAPIHGAVLAKTK